MTPDRDSHDSARRFLALHATDAPLLVMPNAWDVGSARILASLGYQAVATTSSGFAATLGLPDGAVDRDRVLAHAGELADLAGVPVSADLENCYADDPEGVADTITKAAATGLAGASVEDYTGRDDDPVYDLPLATERVRAAAEAAHRGGRGLVLTARAENHLHGRQDLADTITRLRAYRDAGADVVFAPGLIHAEDIAAVVTAVEIPVNVLAFPGCPSLAELADLGVARVSVGGAFCFAAYQGLVDAATSLREDDGYRYWLAARGGKGAVTAAFQGSGRSPEAVTPNEY